MRLVCISGLAVCVVLWLASLGLGQGFEFEITGDSVLSGKAEEVVAGQYTCLLNNLGGFGLAGGWSVSLTADNATITAITFVGTEAFGLLADGFQSSQLTPHGIVDPKTGELILDEKTGEPILGGPGDGDCFEREGAVSSVLLSFSDPEILLLNIPTSIAFVDIEATIPAGGGIANLRFVDGCQGGGAPVDNVVSVPFSPSRFPEVVNKNIFLSSGPSSFVRADSNRDENVNLPDAQFTLNWLFLGGLDPKCMASADANGDGNVNLPDAQFTLNFLFLGGNDPGVPFPLCDISTRLSDIELGCENPVLCSN